MDHMFELFEQFCLFWHTVLLLLEIKHLPYRGQNSLYLDGVHQPWPKAFAGYSFVAKLAYF